MFNGFFWRVANYFLPELTYVTKSKEYFEGQVHESFLEQPVKLFSPFTIYDCTIGKYTYVSRNSLISYTDIGKFCSIGPNLLCGWGIHPTNGISTSPMFYSTKKQNGFSLSATDKIEETKRISIGNDVFIGMNVTILDGIKIADGAIIGASTVVSKDVPPYAIVAGNPMKIIRYRFEGDTIEKLLNIKWWNFDDDKLQEVEKNFFNVESFLAQHSSPSS